MLKGKLLELCHSKKYPDYFSSDLISLYPYMVTYFGEDMVDNFLNEWQYKFVNNIGASGATYYDKKEITVNEYNKSLFWSQRIITALFHEAGHALGKLMVPTNTFLNDGDKRYDDFFSKLEEAIVSDYQDDLLRGELQYDYPEMFNYKCRGDIEHIESYSVSKLYYNVLKIILADKKYLLVQMMYERNTCKKKEIFDEIMLLFSERLNSEKLKTLMNSFAIFIYNCGYSMIDSNKGYYMRRKLTRDRLYKLNYNMVISGEINLEEYNKEFDLWFKAMYDDNYKNVIQYVNDNGIENVGINEQCDVLCEMLVDYLIEQMEKMNDFEFEIVKSVCVYFSKINNRADKFNEKTKRLKELLYLYLDKIEFSFCEEISKKFSKEEFVIMLIKLISLDGVTFEMLNNFKILDIDDKNFIYVSNGDVIVKIGRYADLINDDTKNNHDNDDLGIYVNTTISGINLSFNKYVGDLKVPENFKCTNEFLCQVRIKENQFGKK